VREITGGKKGFNKREPGGTLSGEKPTGFWESILAVPKKGGGENNVMSTSTVVEANKRETI